MIYLLGILFSAIIVAGNTFYKFAVDEAKFELNASFLFSKKMIELLTSWQFLAGLGAFLVATVISFYMLTKFEFSAIQAVTVPVVMALSFVVGHAILHEENLSVINYLGLAIIVVGVVLAANR